MRLPPHHIKSRLHTLIHDLLLLMLTRITQDSVCRVPNCEVTAPPFFYIIVFGSKYPYEVRSYASPPWDWCRQVYTHKLFWIFLYRLVIYFYHYMLMDTCFIPFIIIQYCYFPAHILPVLASDSSFSRLCVTLTPQ